MNRYNRQLIFDFFSDIVKIINIVSRNKDFLHPGALCGHEFFRKTADRIDISLKRYFTGHGNCRTDRNAADQRSESSRQSNPGRGTVFGGCTVRNMNMQVLVFQLCGLLRIHGLNKADCYLSGFFHHIT